VENGSDNGRFVKFLPWRGNACSIIQGRMFQLHVVLDEPKSWLEYVPPWVTAVAALITVLVAALIARNQNKLQKALADKQIEIQKSQLDQQARQLKKDLFDRRFAVFTDVLDFINYVLREDGNIQFGGPGQRQFWEAMEKAEMLFGKDVNAYLADVDTTARKLYVSAKGMNKASATGDVEEINRNGELLSRLSDELLQRRKAVFRPYLSL
jgi:hypothetical protein